MTTINIGFSAQTWEAYHALIAKRHAETLTPEEYEQLIQMSDRLEQLNVTRIQALIQLATFRNQPHPDIVDYV
jgi:predicted HD phosphohydrolase